MERGRWLRSGQGVHHAIGGALSAPDRYAVGVILIDHLLHSVFRFGLVVSELTDANQQHTEHDARHGQRFRALRFQCIRLFILRL